MFVRSTALTTVFLLAAPAFAAGDPSGVYLNDLLGKFTIARAKSGGGFSGVYEGNCGKEKQPVVKEPFTVSGYEKAGRSVSFDITFAGGPLKCSEGDSMPLSFTHVLGTNYALSGPAWAGGKSFRLQK